MLRPELSELELLRVLRSEVGAAQYLAERVRRNAEAAQKFGSAQAVQLSKTAPAGLDAVRGTDMTACGGPPSSRHSNDFGCVQ